MTVLGAHPARLDLYIHPGDPIDFSVPVLDSTGAVVTSLAGYTAAATATALDGAELYSFTPTIVSNQVRVTATAAQTGAWVWSDYAARLLVTATPSAGSPVEVAAGWIRLYRP